MSRALDIVHMATSSGASLAGIVNVSRLLMSPSHKVSGRPEFNRTTKSILVFGLCHERDELPLDWWESGSVSAGNRKMEEIAKALIYDLRTHFHITACLLPYHPKKGGIFLKDAAVLAGLGAMGKNNLTLSPEFGPRIRWRALGMDSNVSPLERKCTFDPCATCDRPCMSACPQNAFEGGIYQRESCMQQMRSDESARFLSTGDLIHIDAPQRPIKYCRACELSCVVGQPG